VVKPLTTPFAILQPYTDKRDRLETAILVSEHGTADEAFAELERLAARIHGFGLPYDVVELLVVDSQRKPVRRGQ
jgi:hypothetical protein